MFGWLVADVNWTNISNDWLGFAIGGYEYVFGNYFWAICFIGLIGYVYAINRSATAAAAAICIVFTIFGFTNIFASPELATFSQFNWVVVVVSLSALFVAVFKTKR